MKAILVDDEPRARKILRAMLEEYCPEVEILDECGNVPQAVQTIHSLRPNLVFLDVDMPGYSGFQLLEFFKDVDFQIIFTTAHSEYAVQAFRVSATDFLLKPLDIDQLVDAVAKARKNTNPVVINQQLEVLREHMQGDSSAKRLALPVADGLLFIHIDEIIYFEADRAYTNLFLDNGKKITASKNIRDFEEMLQKHPRFFRCHRSYMIHLDKIAKFVKTDGGYLQMSNGAEIAISREKRDEFLALIS